MNSQKQIALALRSTLYSHNELLDSAKLADDTDQFSHLFFPEIRGSYDSIELSAATLATTRRIRAGSGVLRPLEHNVQDLVRRLGTVQFLSNNRFVLGIGTGAPGPNPKETIDKMLAMLEETRKAFAERFRNSSIRMPETYIAALKPGIAKRAISHADGLILNFCSPEYARKLIQSLHLSEDHGKTMACYIKIFYSKDGETAKKLLIEEFAAYDRNPSYHEMFVRAGVSDDIASTVAMLSVASSLGVPESLAEISLANPSTGELQNLVSKFQDAGVNLPCIYPYFASSDDTAYKLEIMKQIIGIN